jgi:hypothetical protein
MGTDDRVERRTATAGAVAGSVLVRERDERVFDTLVAILATGKGDGGFGSKDLLTNVSLLIAGSVLRSMSYIAPPGANGDSKKCKVGCILFSPEVCITPAESDPVYRTDVVV